MTKSVGSLLGIAGVLALLFWLGADLREFRADEYLPGDTVKTYYFDKSQRLLEDGVFPQEDKWDFAPRLHQENAPPFLAFFSAFLYKPVSLFADVSFYRFAHIFPLWVFGFWLISLFFIFLNLFSLKTALASSALFAFLPVSIGLTAKGQYFEEVLGAWLLFVAVYAIIQLLETRGNITYHWFYFATAILTLFVLTWQQFVLFYAASVLILLWLVFKKTEEKKLKFLLLIGALLAPLFLGEFISRVLIGIHYSPFGMIGEFLYGAWYYNDPDLLLAMSRSDWANLTVTKFYNYFGVVGFFFGILGALSLIFDYRSAKKYVIGAFSVIGFLALVAFTKDRFFALALFLYLFGVGLEVLFSPLPLLQSGKKILQHCFLLIKETIYFLRSLMFPWKLLVLLGGLLIGVSMLGIFLRPLPRASFSLSDAAPWEIGKPQRVTVRIKNTGGPSLRERDAFGGLHVEVVNAFVSDVKAFAPSTSSRVVFKNFSQTGNVFFFETKYDYLDSQEYGEASFTVTPYAEPVAIYYRAWLPAPCSLSERRKAIEDLLPGWQDVEKAGWRSERCIQRFPRNEDTKEALCRVPVLAAHDKLQYFRCFVGKDVDK